MKMQEPDNLLLPWLGACWDFLWRSRQAERLPHALMVAGPAGMGKRQLVSLLAHSLLCAQPNGQGLPCGTCGDCRLFSAGTHPDHLRIGPDEQGKSDEIKVDAVRRLADADALTAHRGGYKVIVVDPAQRMNAAAANSLLKTLEEPSPNTLLCLVCEQPSRLPATIRSRCQTLHVPAPPQADALAWLQGRVDDEDAPTLLRLAHGAPLRALALAQTDLLPQRELVFAGFLAVAKGQRDPVAEAAAWNRQEPAILLDWLSGWISDLLRLASGHSQPRLINLDKAGALRSFASILDQTEGHRFLQRVLNARATEGSSINRLLLYESLLVDWALRTRSRGR